MTYWALFWIELYFSWLLIEYIAGRYDMIKNNKMQIMGVIGLALFGIFIGCASPEDPETAAVNKGRALARAYNDSVGKAWRGYFDRNVEIEAIEVNSFDIEGYKPDSSKIIAIAYPDDAFTDFEQAFMIARSELGPGKVFFWLGKGYTTDYKTE
jgi:hypothetical protein